MMDWWSGMGGTSAEVITPEALDEIFGMAFTVHELGGDRLAAYFRRRDRWDLSCRRMTHGEVVEFVEKLGGTIVVVASEENGDPEMAWGDTFFFYDPDRVTVPEKRMTFATIVVNDYPGFDEASDLSRPGVFRVNMSVSRETFEQHSPTEDTTLDYDVLDQVIPHPVYGAQSWLSVLNPGAHTDEAVKAMLTEAHRRAQTRYDKQSTR